MRLSRRRKTSGGYTLIEVIITAGVIAVALAELMSVIISTTNIRESTRERTRAKEATVAKLDEIRTAAGAVDDDDEFEAIPATYGGPDADGDEITDGLTFDVAGLSLGDDPGQATTIIDFSNPELLDVRITVRWNRVGGQESTYTMRSLISR